MDNPHAAMCPSCEALICLRCIALEQKMNPEGLDGCEECRQFVKRTARALAKHIAKNHAD